MPTLSVIIITKNEERHIEACIKSVKSIADEIIVVDSGSNDQTFQIAQSLGAKFHLQTDWQGFGIQKNRAISFASSDWVLSIDADERVKPELANSIKSSLQNPTQAHAFLIHRKSWYCGKLINYSGWQNDHVLRLFRRGTATFTNDKVHERLVLTDTNLPCPLLDGFLEHYSFENFNQVLDKINMYSTLWAQDKFAKGKRATPITALLHGFAAFFRTYLFKLGILDGYHGFMLAISNAEGAYYKYIKLWYLQHKNSLKA